MTSSSTPQHTISTSGIVNDVTTILSLVQRLNPVVAALPEVVGLIEAAISTFSAEGKNTIQKAYQDKMAQTDAAHGQTQEALDQAAHPEDNQSPKGGAL